MHGARTLLRPALVLAAVALVLAAVGPARGGPPSNAEAAQQVANQLGVSAADVEILSITFAGSHQEGDAIIEEWNISYRVRPPGGGGVAVETADPIPSRSPYRCRRSRRGQRSRPSPLRLRPPKRPQPAGRRGGAWRGRARPAWPTTSRRACCTATRPP